MMLINNAFKRGDFVYLVTDIEQKKRLVVYLTVFDENDIQYGLICGTECSAHYAFELSAEPDRNMLLGIETDQKHNG